mmetsp:Transcript_90937/g.294291  ORF Transcript_90937/g.294291 Transcript_90937/m.294291 type:complete len:226 (-) Transcript_90937:2708-3385(-)
MARRSRCSATLDKDLEAFCMLPASNASAVGQDAHSGQALRVLYYQEPFSVCGDALAGVGICHLRHREWGERILDRRACVNGCACVDGRALRRHQRRRVYAWWAARRLTARDSRQCGRAAETPPIWPCDPPVPWLLSQDRGVLWRARLQSAFSLQVHPGGCWAPHSAGAVGVVDLTASGQEAADDDAKRRHCLRDHCATCTTLCETSSRRLVGVWRSRALGQSDCA